MFKTLIVSVGIGVFLIPHPVFAQNCASSLGAGWVRMDCEEGGYKNSYVEDEHGHGHGPVYETSHFHAQSNSTQVTSHVHEDEVESYNIWSCLIACDKNFNRSYTPSSHNHSRGASQQSVHAATSSAHQSDEGEHAHEESGSTESKPKGGFGREFGAFMTNAVMGEAFERYVEHPLKERVCGWWSASCGESHSNHLVNMNYSTPVNSWNSGRAWGFGGGFGSWFGF